MTDWCRAPSGNGRFSIQGCGGCFRRPTSEWDPLSVVCSHDVVGLYAHKGTMWNTDDRVPQKDIKSPYGGGVLTFPGAAGGHPPAMFPVVSALPIDGH